VVSLFEPNVHSFDFVRIDGENFFLLFLSFHFSTSKMTLHFIQLKLDKKTYKDQVSTEGCSYVDDFKGAIKTKFSPLLDSFATAQLTLLQPDGTTEIDPETLVTDLEEIPWKPMVVTVEELPIQAPRTLWRARSLYGQFLTVKIFFYFFFPFIFQLQK
jgi:hypothetical protein